MDILSIILWYPFIFLNWINIYINNYSKTEILLKKLNKNYVVYINYIVIHFYYKIALKHCIFKILLLWKLTDIEITVEVYVYLIFF